MIFQVQVFYDDVYTLTFFVNDLCSASIIMRSLVQDSVNPLFEIKPINKEYI